MSPIISSLLGLNDKNIKINNHKLTKCSINGRLSFLLSGQLIEPIDSCLCCESHSSNHSIGYFIF
ncbi:hypothetical protein [Atopobacter phocae]|uniref:hypothetical protein n=1 Tax=Atopobacter phocae TaxID=136492 RepID=UPI00146FA910|nr:hypothetical protein [Atopobacter phocae]